MKPASARPAPPSRWCPALREALARSRNDFVHQDRSDGRARRAPPPVRGRVGERAARGGPVSRQPGVLSLLTRRLLASPGRTAFVLGAAGLAVGVWVNALALQSGAHPNPMFTSAVAVPAKTGPAATVAPAAAVVAARPPAAQPQPAAPREAAAAVQAPAVAQPPERQRDAIGDLLRGGAPTPPPRPAAAAAEVARPAASPQVLSAQKALSRIGYGPLTADGLMGAGTRGAIERFEKASGLPVTGELGPRTLKALSAAAGGPIR